MDRLSASSLSLRIRRSAIIFLQMPANVANRLVLSTSDTRTISGKNYQRLNIRRFGISLLSRYSFKSFFLLYKYETSRISSQSNCAVGVYHVNSNKQVLGGRPHDMSPPLSSPVGAEAPCAAEQTATYVAAVSQANTFPRPPLQPPDTPTRR